MTTAEGWSWDLPERVARPRRVYGLWSVLAAGVVCLVVGGGVGWVAGGVAASHQLAASAGPAAPTAAGTPQSPAEPTPRTTISDGVWSVGDEVQPGVWETRHTVGGNCYWQIARSLDDPGVVRDDLPGPGVTPRVTLQTGQVFVVQDCGTWARRG